jgi:hypothetical protein
MMENKTKKEEAFYYKGEEFAVTSEPYTLFGGECVDAVSIETGKELTVATKVLLRHGVKLK